MGYGVMMQPPEKYNVKKSASTLVLNLTVRCLCLYSLASQYVKPQSMCENLAVGNFSSMCNIKGNINRLYDK